MTNEKTDQQLYQEFLKQNQQSFEALVIRHKNNLIYFIMRYVKRLDIAEEIAQDVFVYLLEHPEKYNFQYSLKTYLYLIGKSRAINYCKKERRLVSIHEQDNYSSDEEELENLIFSQETMRILKGKMEQMKPQYQWVIYLVDMEGLSYMETSKVLGKSLSNTKVLLHRAREKLSNLMRKEEV